MFDNEVEACYFAPLSCLSAVQIGCYIECVQIGVVRVDNCLVFSSLEVMSLIKQAVYNCHQLLIRCIILAFFCRVLFAVEPN